MYIFELEIVLGNNRMRHILIKNVKIRTKKLYKEILINKLGYNERAVSKAKLMYL